MMDEPAQSGPHVVEEVPQPQGESMETGPVNGAAEEEENYEEEEDSEDDLDIKLDSPEEVAKKAAFANKTQGRTFIFPKAPNQTQSQMPSPMISDQQKSAFDIPIDDMEEKPWRKPGADITDYFNYGFNEETWKSYCQKQVSLRLEQSMQGKIKVYESKSNDVKMDLPPELAAMAAGDTSSTMLSPPSIEKSAQPTSRGKRTSQPYPMHPPEEDWNRPQAFDHRRRTREQDDSVIQVLASADHERSPSTPTEPFDKDVFSPGGRETTPPGPQGEMPPLESKFQGAPPSSRASYDRDRSLRHHRSHEESLGEERKDHRDEGRRREEHHGGRYDGRRESSDYRKEDRRAPPSRGREYEGYHKRKDYKREEEDRGKRRR